MKEFIKKFTRKKQMKITIILIIIGTIAYLIDRRTGPGFVSTMEDYNNLPKIWKVIESIVLASIFFILPIFGLIREQIVIDEIYKEKIGNFESLDVKQISRLLNIDFNVLARDKYIDPLSEPNIKKIIKKYFPL